MRCGLATAGETRYFMKKNDEYNNKIIYTLDFMAGTEEQGSMDVRMPGSFPERFDRKEMVEVDKDGNKLKA